MPQSSMQNTMQHSMSDSMVISVSRNTERKLVKYSKRDKDLYLIQHKTIQNFIEEERLKQNKEIIYDNQKKTAEKIVALFQRNGKLLHLLVLARTQSGKTGTSLATMLEFTKNELLLVPRDHVFWITGLSDTDWKEQTEGRLPHQVREHVYHRNELEKEFVKDIKGKKNVLIIIDEIQIAAQEKQTIQKVFMQIGFNDKNYLLEHNIKFVEFTATPDGHAFDLLQLKEYSDRIIMKPGYGYVGHNTLKEKNRLRQCKDLLCLDDDDGEYYYVLQAQAKKNILEIKKDLDTFKEKKYIIIRTPPKYKQDHVFENLKMVFPDLKENINLFKYDGLSDIDKINEELLEIKPKQHTFILIKNKLRCSKTICKKYLGILYERACINYNDSVIIQGLSGRATGYYPDDAELPFVYTNIGSIDRYEDLYKSKFEDSTLPWSSNTTRRKYNTTSSKGTFNSHYLQIGYDVDAPAVDVRPKISYREFKTLKEAKDFFDETLKPRFQKMFQEDKGKDNFSGKGQEYNGKGPRKPRQNTEGFYKVAIGNKQGLRVYSRSEIIGNVNGEEKLKINYNITRNSGRSYFKLYPCYVDKTDITSLTFILAYV